MRIRTIKPGFWISEDMAEVSDQALLLAIGLLNFADDEGYFSANIALIRAALFPLRKVPALDGLMAELAKVGYLELVTGTDGRKYGRIRKFADHQRINRPSESLIAPFWPPAGALTEDSLNPHGALTEDSSPEGKGKEEERKQERKQERKAALERREAMDLAFAIFWQEYPVKENKKGARESFEKVDVDVSVLLKAIEAQKQGRKWREGFIPHPTTWLNNRRWEDEVQTELGAKLPPSVQASRDGRLYPGPATANVVRITHDDEPQAAAQ